MKALGRDIIAAAARAAGLPEGRVIDLSKKDNMTIPRPRMELQWLPESYTRNGRKFGHIHTGNRAERLLKRARYQVRHDISAVVYAQEEAWLESFCDAFLLALPRGVNDSSGNWVAITAKSGAWKDEAQKRVGLSAIKVFERAQKLLVITLSRPLTVLEAQTLITRITITPNYRGASYGK